MRRRTVLAIAVVAIGACDSASGRPAADSLDVAVAEPVAHTRGLPRATPVPPPAPRKPPVPLSPLADSIANYLVFAPAGEVWFTAASRQGRMLLDIGRVDIEVRRDSARAAAYREAVASRTTVPVGATFRLRGPWGAEDVKAKSVDSWNGRIVLRLSGSPGLDSLVRGKSAVVASAFLTDSSAPPVRDSCDRTTLPLALGLRVLQVRDSLEQTLRAGPPPPYPRLRQRMTVASSQLTGCFGPSRVALVVSLIAGNIEWVRERIVLIDDAGRVTPLRVVDYRFRAHTLLGAFDADGDGVDDLATRATTERAGGTSILVLDVKHRQLVRLTSGFAWESQ